MPFKSLSQKRWMYANDAAMAARWEKDTPANAKLPEHVKDKKREPEKPKGHWPAPK